jgi:hypothetical protein
MNPKSNKYAESGTSYEPPATMKSEQATSSSLGETAVDTKVLGKLQNSVNEKKLDEPPELVLSDFSVQNQVVPVMDQDDFSRLSIAEFDRPISFISETTIEEYDTSLRCTLDRLQCHLQKCFPGGIKLIHLREFLNDPKTLMSIKLLSLIEIVIQLHEVIEPFDLFDKLCDSHEYVHVTASDTLYVRFSKSRADNLDDFEAILITESDKAKTSFNANDKISMSIEEYALRMANVFKKYPSKTVFTAEDFTNELSGDNFACSIVNFLHDYVQYYDELTRYGELDETSEFFCLQNEKSAYFIHQLNTITPLQLGCSENILWQLLVSNKSMYSEFFEFDGNVIQLQDRSLLSIMFKKDIEDILPPGDFKRWYCQSGMSLFDQYLHTTQLEDDANNQCFYYDYVRLKSVQTCVSASVTIHNKNVLQMENNLAEAIDRFLSENTCDLAIGRDAFKASGFFPYLAEGREHLIKAGQLMIYNGTYKERCFVMKPLDDNLDNVMNQTSTYFARHFPSSLKQCKRRRKEKKKVPEFETTCNNILVYYLDYGYAEKVIKI